MRSALDVMQSSGAQQPRVEWVPPGRVHADSEAALELVDAIGLNLFPWQRHVFTSSLLERDGRWAAFEVGLCVPRQNGKTELALARILAGLFVLGEPLIIYTAHLADTSKEMFRRLVDMIDANDWLAAEVRHVWRTNGHEQVELKSGQRVRFRTRTKGGGRGYAGVSCVILDEAMILPEASIGSLMPVVSASPNPQLWYLGSAVDQVVHEDGVPFTRIRERGIKGSDPSLAWFEWSLPYSTPLDVPAAEAASPEAWAVANPSLGFCLDEGRVANEQRSMDPRTFAVERGGVGDWPAIGGANAVISLEKWAKLADPASKPQDPVFFAPDVSPDRSQASIGVCGARPDGLPHVEVVQRDRGTGWLIPRLVELRQRHPQAQFVADGAGPVGSLIPELERQGVEVHLCTPRENAQACGMFYDAVAQETVRHLGTPELVAALQGATQRPLGEAWAWSRRNSAVDISPLVACTLALWGHLSFPSAAPFMEVW